MTNIRFALAAILLLLAQAAYVADAEEIVVGIREDARPFAWYDAEQERFRGFVVDVCNYAFDKMRVVPVEVPVNARNRFGLLDKPVAKGGVDMLCDTTSVTISRAERRLFSPIIFLSGVSYAVSPSAEQAQIDRVASKQNGANDGCSGANDKLEPATANRPALLRVGVLGGTTASEAVRSEEARALFRLQDGEAICIESGLRNYATGIRELCNGKLAYFFGDRDMLAYYLDEYRGTEGGENCDAVLSRKFFSYEPYALVIRDDRLDIVKRLQVALFQLFRDRESLDEIFGDSFDGREPSELLSALFRINAIGKL